uniref:DNA-binding protein n=1 Tax=Bosea sp. NBC_00436 TaxID=2969620 RepID=A0A9E7ZLD8_9HYPH
MLHTETKIVTAGRSSDVAHRIDDLVRQGPFGRTGLFAAIKAGKLKARKFGRSTIVLHRDWLEFLENLPLSRAHDA